MAPFNPQIFDANRPAATTISCADAPRKMPSMATTEIESPAPTVSTNRSSGGAGEQAFADTFRPRQNPGVVHPG